MGRCKRKWIPWSVWIHGDRLHQPIRFWDGIGLEWHHLAGLFYFLLLLFLLCTFWSSLVKCLVQVDRESGVEAFYYARLNAYGVPEYSALSFRYWAPPPSVLDCQRSYYDPSTDTMYLSGSTVANTYVCVFLSFSPYLELYEKLIFRVFFLRQYWLKTSFSRFLAFRVF
jgi:hypothetical protein